MPDVISDTNGKLCVGSYHMWRLLSNPDNYSFIMYRQVRIQGGPRGPGPPLTLGFEAPKLSIFGPYLNFSIIFFLPRFTRQILVSHILGY